ncbi:FHA domain-containing protein [Microbacterium sp. 4R-513]|uniref:DUF5684 domain-containing protein n=1 Tax=Microbacterium sp. 4R-513 TaxID=2567934 RepID=UPI0013E12DE7|nr:DUF5684 domain-containing protein [Microbacterium sp. 4R-513]QIG38601.1 FHA domain-containing protein [Microbacterium sp. 4R-513]
MSNFETWTGITLGLTSTLVVLLIYVWTAIALSAVFRKSGEAGWKAWVPILNIVVLLRLGGLSGWLVLLFIIPILGWICLIIAVYRINVAFGHGGGMTVLAWFLFPVWATVLGFGSDRWVGREEAARGPVRTALPDVPPPPPLPGDGRRATTAYSPVAPPPAYGRPPSPAGASAAPAAVRTAASSPAASAPVAAPAAGWTPPPLPPQAASAAVTGVPGGGTSTAGTDRPVFEAPVAAPAVPVRSADPGDDDDSDEASGIPVSSLPRRTRTPLPEPEWEVEDDADPPSDEPSWDVDFGGAASTSEVTDAVTNAPAPISAAPRRAVQPDDEPVIMPRRAVPSPEADADEAAPEPPVTSVPTAPTPAAAMREPWAPAASPVPTEGEAFPESSGPVSAIAGAPDAGGPRSALSSVSALHTRPHIPEEDELEATVVARRKRTAWTLVDASGTRIPLTSDVVLLGRRPAADPEFPGAQLVSLDDDTRTISKTHARLELRDDKWYITDLDSTNGVLFTTLMGTEVAATPGEQTEAGETFLLGDAEVSLSRSDG